MVSNRATRYLAAAAVAVLILSGIGLPSPVHAQVASKSQAPSVAQRIAQSIRSGGNTKQLIASIVARNPAAATEVIAALNAAISQIEASNQSPAAKEQQIASIANAGTAGLAEAQQSLSVAGNATAAANVAAAVATLAGPALQTAVGATSGGTAINQVSGNGPQHKTITISDGSSGGFNDTVSGTKPKSK